MPWLVNLVASELRTVISASISVSIASRALMLRTCRPDHLSVSRSVLKVYCGKTADWIWMPFGMVSGVSRGMSVFDGGGDSRSEGAVLGVNLGHPVVTSGDFVA